jgi:hypothetical protein
MRYVVGNFASHSARRGEPLGATFVDPFSSAAAKTRRAQQLALFVEPPTSTARTWLLRNTGRDGTRRSGRTAGG